MEIKQNRNSANIVFIHKSDSWYLSYALNQVVLSNPTANIYLIGDDSNNKYKNVNYLMISDFSKKATEFAKIYKHFSTTDYHHELFCIQRWFILLEFMERYELENAMLLDTDVLIFQDINTYLEKINVDFQFSQGTTNTMGFVYFKNHTYLKNICDFITNQYLNPKIVALLKNEYEEYVKEYQIGGVSDITLFDWYKRDNSGCVFNFETPPLGGMAFINSLESPLYIQNKHKYVDIKWINKIPYGTLFSGEEVSIIGVHCFGLQKLQIRKLYQGKNKWLSRIIYCWKRTKLKYLFDIIRGRKSFK